MFMSLLKRYKGRFYYALLALQICACNVEAASTVITVDYTPNLVATNFEGFTYDGSDTAWQYDGSFQNEIDKLEFTLDLSFLSSVQCDTDTQTVAVSSVAYSSSGEVIDMTEWVYIRPSSGLLFLSLFDSLIVGEVATASRVMGVLLIYESSTIPANAGMCDLSGFDLSSYSDSYVFSQDKFNDDSGGGTIDFGHEANLSVSVVPEPSSFLLFGITGFSLILGRSRCITQ